jgi:lipid-A-disaccharide synthase-like uncharacterized protein
LDKHAQIALWAVVLGYAANGVFGCRFVVQWLASERAGRSIVPKVFWHISIIGSLLELVYAVAISHAIGWKDGLPLILGQAPNVFIYARNIMLIEKHERAAQPAAVTAPVPAECASEEEVSANG